MNTANWGWLIRKTAASLFGAGTRPASILLTHDPPDHSGSAVELTRYWECPVYLHPDELPYAVADNLATMAPHAHPLDRWVIFPLLRLMPPHRVASILSKASFAAVVRAFDPGAAAPGLPE
jgi:glyoxylase-like metal-dependent hydrolase (beta-lactamase superfamily II)